MTYLDALRYLYGLADFERTGRFADRQDIAPMLALLKELGNPQLGRLTVHIAGSKGKGSVAAMVASILKAAGLSTGLFTSPHLNRFPERIQIDGEPVSNDEFAAGIEEVAAAIEDVKVRMPDRILVTFDALTALGFLLFRQHELQAQVIEVGLGGLLDSTNVFGPGEKQCSVITNIGLEHREILGEQVKILESYLAPADFEVDGTRIKKGTWLLAVRIVDDELWRQIKAGDLTGFSIGAIPPIGHIQPIRVVMDPDLGRHPVVWAAAGTSSAVFPVAPRTLSVIANALVAPIAEKRP